VTLVDGGQATLHEIAAAACLVTAAAPATGLQSQNAGMPGPYAMSPSPETTDADGTGTTRAGVPFRRHHGPRMPLLSGVNAVDSRPSRKQGQQQGGDTRIDPVNWTQRLTAHRWLLTILAAVLLMLAAAGVAFAFRDLGTNESRPLAQDSSPDPEVAPTADELERVVQRLERAGVTTDTDTVAQLASEHGLGGAVRLLWWSTIKPEISVEEIVAMRTGDADTAPMGWGRIAKELGVHPGIGRVMGGGQGNPPEEPPGQ